MQIPNGMQACSIDVSKRIVLQQIVKRKDAQFLFEQVGA
jgi:hypothetical protein